MPKGQSWHQDGHEERRHAPDSHHGRIDSGPVSSVPMTTPFARPLATMEAKVKDDFPENGWAYEPKWDGFRALAWSDGPYLDSRSQKPLLRYFPELAEAISGLPAGTVVDCEIVVVTGDQLSFDSLQMRLHPAESRVQRLSAEIPAEMVAFDLLALKGEDLRDRPFSERRTKLKKLLGKAKKPWNLTPSTTDIEVGRRWFEEFESAGCDGIVAKQLDSPYVSGKREMVKIKHRRSVDVVIGGFREHKDGGKIGSLLLGLYNDAGELHFIGHCSGFSNHDRVEMLKRFEALTVDGSFGEEARQPRRTEPLVSGQGPLMDANRARRRDRGLLRSDHR